MPQFCHARDVADAHIKWLTSSDAPSQRYLLQGGQFSWGMAVHHIADNRPNLIPRLPIGWQESSNKKVEASGMDVTPAIEELGINFKTWQETLLSSIDQLLLLEKASM